MDSSKAFSKHYFEKYAQLSLKFCGFPYEFKISDEPDLQNDENNIGVEVTRAISTNEGFSQAVWNKYANKGLSSNEFAKKPECQSKKFCYEIIPDDKHRMAVINEDMNANSLITKILQTIEIKQSKIDHYKKFGTIGLYIFSDAFPDQMSYLQQEIIKINSPFDFYIINLQDKIFIIDENKIQEFNLNHEQLVELKQSAKDYENSLDSKQ